MSAAAPGAVRPVLVGGHESAGGTDLEPLLQALPGAAVTTPGRPLHNTVSALLAARDDTVAVLPMTWGRDPVMVADTAKTLRWLNTGQNAGRLVLCDAFGSSEHLVALLRRAATETTRRHPGAGLLITAPSANPFDDAELYRVAHLVATYGTGADIEVACVRGIDDYARAVRRSRLLGSDEVVVVPAGFARSCPALDAVEHATFFGPLLSERAVLQIVDQRLTAARHALSHGSDGIVAGLSADHGHGYAHSHAGESAASGSAHAHAHPHPHDTQAPHLVASPAG